MNNKMWGIIMQIPAWLVLIGSFIASVYVKVTNAYPIQWGAIILLLIIIALYFGGRFLEKKSSDPFSF